MFNGTTLEHILAAIPRLKLGVLGDLFLDRYLDIDPGLTEPSLETGLDAYQVVRVRPTPGAAGTVINNLVALGVGRLAVIAVIGDDGEGYELRQALQTYPSVETTHLVAAADRRTPTYTKPMLLQPGAPRELNRLDIKNRNPLPPGVEDRVLAALEETWPQIDALLVLDQVSEADCGVVTARVRQRLADLGERDSGKIILADSRERIGLFRSVWLKPNRQECARAAPVTGDRADRDSAVALAERTGRPVFCTQGERGILVVDPRPGSRRTTLVPAYSVAGPIDVVGAGDSTSAALACALAAGVGLEEAAAFGNLVASVTIQQIGTTGTAPPEQVRRRWQKVASRERQRPEQPNGK
jgi:rfaE bifunctional protein kinase chain/domain